MASPLANGAPTTPPPSDPVPTASSNLNQAQSIPLDPSTPLTSLQDDGLSKRPRDARLIHLVLSSLGIHSYQERVPLQLLDFAYRYTSSVLSDSLRLAAEGYAGGPDSAAGGRGGGNRKTAAGTADGAADGAITVMALRQAIASRTGYQFAGPLGKEFMMEQAQERNRLALPKVDTRGGGLQLPPEKYCLTGVGWGLREGWESEEEEEEDGMRANGNAAAAVGVRSARDERMGGTDGAADDEEEEDDKDEDGEGAARMEDVFGEEGGGDGGGEDTDMGQD